VNSVFVLINENGEYSDFGYYIKGVFVSQDQAKAEAELQSKGPRKWEPDKHLWFGVLSGLSTVDGTAPVTSPQH
jgi:hypothetical protein